MTLPTIRHLIAQQTDQHTKTPYLHHFDDNDVLRNALRARYLSKSEEEVLADTSFDQDAISYMLIGGMAGMLELKPELTMRIITYMIEVSGLDPAYMCFRLDPKGYTSQGRVFETFAYSEAYPMKASLLWTLWLLVLHQPPQGLTREVTLAARLARQTSSPELRHFGHAPDHASLASALMTDYLSKSEEEVLASTAFDRDAISYVLIQGMIGEVELHADLTIHILDYMSQVEHVDPGYLAIKLDPRGRRNLDALQGFIASTTYPLKASLLWTAWLLVLHQRVDGGLDAARMFPTGESIPELATRQA